MPTLPQVPTCTLVTGHLRLSYPYNANISAFGVCKAHIISAHKHVAKLSKLRISFHQASLVTFDQSITSIEQYDYNQIHQSAAYSHRYATISRPPLPNLWRRALPRRFLLGPVAALLPDCQWPWHDRLARKWIRCRMCRQSPLEKLFFTDSPSSDYTQCQPSHSQHRSQTKNARPRSATTSGF
jgi:hypothetical protein